MGKPGRPSKLTPERREQILEALRNGATRSAASEAVGIQRCTFYEWLAQYPAFQTAVRAAEAEAQSALVKVIHTAALVEGDWRAAEALLKRRWPDEFGDRVVHDVDDDIARILEALAPGQEAAAAGGAAR